MATLAYVRENADWQENAWLNFSDLIGAKQPGFVFLTRGDLVLTLEACIRTSLGVEEWLLGRLFRVSKWEETGDAFDYHLDLERILSEPNGTRYAVSRAELVQIDLPAKARPSFRRRNRGDPTS